MIGLISFFVISLVLNGWLGWKSLRGRKDVRWVFNKPGLRPGCPMELTFAKGGTKLYVITEVVDYDEFRKHWPMVPDDPDHGYYKVTRFE